MNLLSKEQKLCVPLHAGHVNKVAGLRLATLLKKRDSGTGVLL